MAFRCTNEACRAQLDEDEVQPDLGEVGWFFTCPQCRQPSPLIDVSLRKDQHTFVQVPWIPEMPDWD